MKTSAPPTLTTGPDELVVRMYRQGLGDCFLLALPAKDEVTRYLLIDCGVHARETKGSARLAQVLNDIAAATGSRVDVVVATHEHADHLSGFVQKGSPFLLDSLAVDEVWLAWTEMRGDHQADTLRKKRGTARAVIEKAVDEARTRAGQVGVALADHLNLLTDFETPAAGSVDEQAVATAIARFVGQSAPGASDTPLAFLGSPGRAIAKAAKKPRASANEIALHLLAAKAGDARVKYCEPGETRAIAGVEGLRAHVLGPPRSSLLEKENPSKIRGAKEDSSGGQYNEVYLTATGGNRALELSPRFDLDAQAGGGALPSDWRYPFAGLFYRQCEVSAKPGVGKGKRWSSGVIASTRSFFDRTYFDPAQSWRRIDGDWLGAAESVALNLVGDTNNTSLVLALEWGRPGSGQILLFAADAQVGNWLSWRDQTYAGKERITADDLMRRVILYKVGHHGSHNATIRRDPREASDTDVLGAPYGLELMNDIIAMIPVDSDAAQKKMPDPWKMPHEPLYRRLRERARRRVLRSDEAITPLNTHDDEKDLVPKTTAWAAVPGLSGVRWRRSKDEFTDGTKGPLYYDVAFTRPN